MAHDRRTARENEIHDLLRASREDLRHARHLLGSIKRHLALFPLWMLARSALLGLWWSLRNLTIAQALILMQIATAPLQIMRTSRRAPSICGEKPNVEVQPTPKAVGWNAGLGVTSAMLPARVRQYSRPGPRRAKLRLWQRYGRPQLP